MIARSPRSPLGGATRRQLARLRLAVHYGHRDAGEIRLVILAQRATHLAETGQDSLIEPAPDWQHAALVALHMTELAERLDHRFERRRAVVRGRALRLPCCIWVYSHTH